MRGRARRPRHLITVVLGACFAARCGGSPTAPSIGPYLACPASQAIQTAAGNVAPLTFFAPTFVGGTSPVTVTCTPASGTLLPVGLTTVTCTATDAKQERGFCTFNVDVTQAPKLGATRFVAFGNSITEGKLSSGVIVPDSYPADLQALLAARYTSQTIAVVTRGCGGETAVAGGDPPCGGGVVRLPGVLSADNPDAVLLEEGVNDLSGGNPAAVAPMIEALRTMIRQARTRGVQVFMATLLPERPGGSRAGAMPLINTANDQIRQLAVAEGARLVDLYQGLGSSPDPFIGDDGLHPTEVGYQKIAQLFFDAIRANLDLPQGAVRPIELVRAEPFARVR